MWRNELGKSCHSTFKGVKKKIGYHKCLGLTTRYIGEISKVFPPNKRNWKILHLENKKQ